MKANRPAAGTTGGGEKVVASNRRARHDYEILETHEAGMVLVGSEVKSLRDSKVQLKDAYARIEDGELVLIGVHISPYAFATGAYAHNPERTRKLLMHRREIAVLGDRLAREHLTLVPLSIYFTGGRAKVELGLAKGKRTHDKRASIAERDAKRDIDRAMSASVRKTLARRAARETG